MGFLRQEYWSGLPFPSPGDLADSGVESESPTWQADSLPMSHLGSPLMDYEYLKCISTLRLISKVVLLKSIGDLNKSNKNTKSLIL